MNIETKVSAMLISVNGSSPPSPLIPHRSSTCTQAVWPAVENLVLIALRQNLRQWLEAISLISRLLSSFFIAGNTAKSWVGVQ